MVDASPGFALPPVIEPGPTDWQFPLPKTLGPEDLAAVGADLEPGTLLTAYTNGYFPMPINRRSIGWFNPAERGILRPGSLVVSRSTRRSLRRYQVTVNKAFDEVLSACADPARPHGWIDRRIRNAYRRLHEMGWVHSVEAWDDEGLAGGLYGIGMGALFAGESMFHRRSDASKVALHHLVEFLGSSSSAVEPLIDVQWLTPHLASLGAEEVDRAAYLELVHERLANHSGGCGPFAIPTFSRAGE